MRTIDEPDHDNPVEQDRVDKVDPELANDEGAEDVEEVEGVEEEIP
jgi:hypothetical protein